VEENDLQRGSSPIEPGRSQPTIVLSDVLRQ